jgi:hypothetical protein
MGTTLLEVCSVLYILCSFNAKNASGSYNIDLAVPGAQSMWYALLALNEQAQRSAGSSHSAR